MNYKIILAVNSQTKKVTECKTIKTANKWLQQDMGVKWQGLACKGNLGSNKIALLWWLHNWTHLSKHETVQFKPLNNKRGHQAQSEIQVYLLTP